jgi:MoaA/NifB/PqqE/SkfB family radical SAM enzyme
MEGRSVAEYRAPLFLAWQLTNRCGSRCIACCEESGPDKAWADELTSAEALHIADCIAAFGIPSVAFGGGEPLGVPHCWKLFERLTAAGVSLKIETDGSHIDDAAADRIAALGVQCVQISIDGATAAVHERVRPGSSFERAVASIKRLVARGLAPQLVFVPNRINIDQAVAAYELAISLGCSACVTGPMMRIGRAAPSTVSSG